MKKLIISASIILSSLFAGSVYALNVAGVELDDIKPATSERPELKLNGGSLRELYSLVDTYVGALYLEEKSTDPQTIFQSDTHRRMEFHVKLKKVGARRIVNALQEALVLNITEDHYKEIEEQLGQMLSYFRGKLQSGDMASFEYIPGKGTIVAVNDTVKGVIPGKQYFDAMLSVWIGEKPVTREFKDGVLGLNRENETTMVAGQ